MEISDEQWVTYFIYLDNLRESGVTNMFGAVPYLSDYFHMSFPDARRVLKAWHETFSDELVSVRVERIK